MHLDLIESKAWALIITPFRAYLCVEGHDKQWGCESDEDLVLNELKPEGSVKGMGKRSFKKRLRDLE